MSKEEVNLAIFLILTTITILILVIVGIGLITAYQKKQLLFHSQIENLKLDHENNLLIAQLEVQENTFKDISREIHDNINLSLSLAKLNLNSFEWGNKNKALGQLESTVQIIGKVISELSNISKSINSEMIEGLGLVSAIENEIDRIQATKIFEIQFDLIGDPISLSSQSELTIFRIIQEAFNNIIKHANAASVKLELQYLNNLLVLQIIDDGEGFDPFAKVRGTSNGLRNMQMRARMINGHMSINSKRDIGTTLVFRIPINNLKTQSN